MTWSTRAMAVVIVPVLIFCGAPVVGQNTSFSFPSGYPDQDKLNMELSGDALILSDAQGVSMNLQDAFLKGAYLSQCGRVVFKDKVRVKNNATGTVASFNTSFTFNFASSWTTVCGDGMAFAFYRNKSISDLELLRGGRDLCVFDRSDTHLRLFAVAFDSFQNTYDKPNETRFSDISDSQVSVYLGNTNISTHNLCENGVERCAYFCGDSNADFTAWIVYDGEEEVLVIWFSEGSLPSVAKPLRPVITIRNLNLNEVLDEEMYVGFTASTGDLQEVHTIKSWVFASSGMPSIPAPVPSPTPSPPPAPESDVSPENSELNPDFPTVTTVLAGVCAGLALASVLGGGLLCYFWSQHKKSLVRSFQNTDLFSSIETRLKAFTYTELSRAMKKFKKFNESEFLSSGAFGNLYRLGTRPPELAQEVAVQPIKASKEQLGEASFLAGAAGHGNRRQLRGWSSHTREGLFLVHDYMRNGSLDNWLYRNPNNANSQGHGHTGAHLGWNDRLDILAAVASGLEYLHEELDHGVLHRHVTQNADFDASSGDIAQKGQKTTSLAGTLGYMAPELQKTGTATKETDVYAFGILVLEVVCGRRPLDLQATSDEDNVLLGSVWRAHESGNILQVADITRLVYNSGNSTPHESDRHAMIAQVLHVGLLCCLATPAERPSMREVHRWFQFMRLGEIVELPPLPATRPHSSGSAAPSLRRLTSSAAR